jgi:hypothetical protein
MREKYELCTTVPHNEQCAQVGSENYMEFSRMEAEALKSQLIRLHGEPPFGTRLRTISCPHDFGSYLDVAIEYNEDDEEAVDWMLAVESGVPDTWDDQAKKELREQGYTLEFFEEE